MYISCLERYLHDNVVLANKISHHVKIYIFFLSFVFFSNLTTNHMIYYRGEGGLSSQIQFVWMQWVQNMLVPFVINDLSMRCPWLLYYLSSILNLFYTCIFAMQKTMAHAPIFPFFFIISIIVTLGVYSPYLGMN